MVAFILIFSASWLTGNTLGFLLRKLFESLKLGWLDRMLGGLFGFFKGGLLVTVMIIIMYITPAFRPTLDKSFLGPRIVKTTFKIMALLPEN
jgi:uncharacterized membrane protein required for colicin V production